MQGKKTKTKASVVLLLALSLVLPLMGTGTSAWADNGFRGGDHRHAHYYRNGHWYRHGWFGWEVPVPTLTTGVYVDTLPPAYTPVVVQGTTYYYGDNTYFTASPQGGYVVVRPVR